MESLWVKTDQNPSNKLDQLCIKNGWCITYNTSNNLVENAFRIKDNFTTLNPPDFRRKRADIYKSKKNISSLMMEVIVFKSKKEVWRKCFDLGNKFNDEILYNELIAHFRDQKLNQLLYE